jgi:hypothetical protein
MFNDLRFVFRQLLKDPGFTAVAVLTLALGIEANTAVFSVVSNVLLRSLPSKELEPLIQGGIDECRRRAVAVVFVLGAPEFYSHFGFIPAHTRGLRSVYEASPDAFQMLSLDDTFVVPSTGLIRYRPEFDCFP